MENKLNDKTLLYPRLCAHRGWSEVLPENSILVDYFLAVKNEFDKCR